MRKECSYFKLRLLVNVVFVMALIVFGTIFQGKLFAKTNDEFDIQLNGINGENIIITGSNYEMYSKEECLQVVSNNECDIQEVEWSIVLGSSVAEVESLTPNGKCMINALKPGSVMLVASVKYKDVSNIVRIRMVDCTINVEFAIIRDEKTEFQKRR